MTDDIQRIEQLEAALASQHVEIARLRADLAAVVGSAAARLPTQSSNEGGHDQDDPRVAGPKRSSRRAMLTGSAVAAGAAFVGATVAPQTAAAADGGPMLIGNQNNSAAGNTRIVTTSPGALLDGTNILTVSDNLTSSSYESAIGAVAQGLRVTNGMYAYTEGRVDDNVATGHAIVARRTAGARSAIFMPPSANAPTTDTYQHSRGELRVDNAGILWYCVSNGTPGTWRRLAGSASAGAVHAIDPKRAYDSRLTDGPITTGGERVVSVVDGIDVDTGVVTTPNLVPVGATAIFFNLAITQTSGSGFLQLAPGDATEVTAATINWETSNLSVSNASFSTLDNNRKVKILSGGTGATHFIIDITGYTL